MSLARYLGLARPRLIWPKPTFPHQATASPSRIRFTRRDSRAYSKIYDARVTNRVPVGVGIVFQEVLHTRQEISGTPSLILLGFPTSIFRPIAEAVHQRLVLTAIDIDHGRRFDHRRRGQKSSMTTSFTTSSTSAIRPHRRLRGTAGLSACSGAQSSCRAPWRRTSPAQRSIRPGPRIDRDEAGPVLAVFPEQDRGIRFLFRPFFAPGQSSQLKQLDTVSCRSGSATRPAALRAHE